MFLSLATVTPGLVHNLKYRFTLHALRRNGEVILAICSTVGRRGQLVTSKVHVVSPVKHIGEHENQRKKQFRVAIDIAGVLNCETVNNPLDLFSEDALDLVTGFHCQVTVVHVITTNFNIGKADLPFKAGDGTVDDVGDIDFVHLLRRPLVHRECS